MYSDYYVYDIENYCNVFTCRITRDSDGAKWCFEISLWKQEGFELFILINQIAASGGAMVGYNNRSYDYPVLHLLMEYQGRINNAILFNKGSAIIRDGNIGQKWNHIVWDNKMYCPQIDLMAIHHFDNKSKATSLKLLEFNMRMDDIQELPYDPTIALNREQTDNLIYYNGHDVDATLLFLQHTKSMINFRYELAKQFNRPDFINMNDTKIGEQITVETLKKSGVTLQKGDCTIRTKIPVADIIFPYVQFKTRQFQNIHRYLMNTVFDPDNLSETLMGQEVSYEMAMDSNPSSIWVMLADGRCDWLDKLRLNDYFDLLSARFWFKYVKDSKTNINTIINGFQFDIGAGGIHGSKHTTIVRSGKGRKLKDSDVASYYPNLGIKNNCYPAHIGPAWCDANQWMYDERLRVGKKTDLGGGMKLALNGGYGKTKDKFSVLYDPQYTMTITINGQLLLCMLAEKLILEIPEFEMVQINTDGLTYTYPEEYEQQVMDIMMWWENLTKLELEHVDYRMMAIRDVNNYIAVTAPYVDNEGKLNPSKIKRIGCYAYERPDIVNGKIVNAQTRELPWHKNHSAIVVAKAAEAALVRNQNIRDFITHHLTVDPYDFFLRTKVKRNNDLYLETDVMWGNDVIHTKRVEVPRITRFYVSKNGGKLIKEMEPTDNKKREWLTKPHFRHVDTGVTKQAKKAPSGKWVRCEPPTPEPPINRSVLPGTDGYKITTCNTLSDHWLALPDIDIDYYVDQTRKIVDSLF